MKSETLVSIMFITAHEREGGREEREGEREGGGERREGREEGGRTFGRRGK